MIYNHFVQTCKQCNQSFEITDEDRKFYRDVAPGFGNKTYPIPDPQLCHICRQKRRLACRNLRTVYLRKCDFSGRTIFSMFDENCPQKVYASDIWWSDKWDPLEYGRDFDFSRPFFEQFAELFHEVPLLQSSVLLTENCDYINGAAKCKDCYLSFNMDYCEQCYYLSDAKYCTTVLDSYSMVHSELCYECLDCEHCYHLMYSRRCTSCKDSFFLADCRQMKNCIACCNLVGKEYYIFNKKCTPGEFQEFKEKLKDRAELEKIKKEFEDFALRFPKKYYTGHSNDHFSGDHIHNVKNSTYCYDTFELENCKYCYYIFKSHNCMDYDIFGDHSEWIYNCLATGINCSNNINCAWCWNGCSNNLYCTLVSAVKNCFGCSGLKQKQYCILNKQYSREEYQNLAPKIIEHMIKTGEWGEFFHPSLLPHGYNETMAQEFFPMKKEEALAQGFQWKEIPRVVPKSTKTIPASRLPDKITDVPDDVLSWAISCSATRRLFKVIPQELKFYRDHGIPLPHFHPEERHQQRLKLRNPRILYDRQCDKCHMAIKTTYSPDRPEKVYCEPCYLKEVY